jgi:hypothetical protein
MTRMMTLMTILTYSEGFGKDNKRPWDSTNVTASCWFLPNTATASRKTWFRSVLPWLADGPPPPPLPIATQAHSSSQSKRAQPENCPWIIPLSEHTATYDYLAFWPWLNHSALTPRIRHPPIYLCWPSVAGHLGRQSRRGLGRGGGDLRHR